jgi:hypothetical protein
LGDSSRGKLQDSPKGLGSLTLFLFFFFPFFFFLFLFFFFLLHVPLKSTSLKKSFSAVLVIPNAFVYNDVKVMVDVLLKDLGFKSVIMHQASVAAALGAGLSSACVVDVGAQKTCVACVEDGVSLPRSRFLVCFPFLFLFIFFNFLFFYSLLDVS